jgi:predicted MFS family arabinose efflux permease
MLQRPAEPTEGILEIPDKRPLVFGTFAFAYFLSYFFRSTNAIIAPDLLREFSLTASDLGFMTGLFYGAFALVQLPLGVALDAFGPRRTTAILMLVAVAGSCVFAFAQSFAMLAVGRALIGLGMAGILMGALKAFSQWYSSRAFSTVSGILIGIGASGALVGANPLAWLNHSIGWRQVFVWGAVLISVSAASILLLVRDVPPGRICPSLRGTERGLMILADIRFWRIATLSFFMGGTQLALQGLWAGPYLFDVWQLSAASTANILLLMGLGVIAGYVASGWLAARMGIKQVVVIGALVFAFCLLMLGSKVPPAVLQMVFFVAGVSGAFNVMLLAHVSMIFPSRATGRAVTAVNLFVVGGAFLIQWWIGVLLARFPRDLTGSYPSQAYALAFGLCAITTLAATLWYLPTSRTGPTSSHQQFASPSPFAITRNREN